MKKTFLLVTACLLVLSSQSFALLRLGFKGGVNLANITVSKDTLDYKMKPGFAVGLSAEVPLAPTGGLALRTELLYVQKGAKFTALNQDGKLNIDEFVLAPFLVFRFPAPKITPFLQLGPELGLTTKEEQDAAGTTRGLGADWKQTNFGLNVGAGVLVPVGANDLSFDVRYNLGLANMAPKLYGATGGDTTTRTNGIQVFFGFNFLRI